MYSSTISLLTRLLNVSDDKALYYFNHLMAFAVNCLYVLSLLVMCMYLYSRMFRGARLQVILLCDPVI